MSSMMVENAVSLRQVSDSVCEIINLALQKLASADENNDNEGNDSEVANTLEVCIEQIETLGDAAGYAGFLGLQLTAEVLCQHLVELKSDNAFARENIDPLLEWTGDVMAYCQDPSDISVAGMLINPLPVKSQAEVRTALARDAVTFRRIDSEVQADLPEEDPIISDDAFPEQDDVALDDEVMFDDADLMDIFGSDDEAEDGETDSILSMLSHELSSVSPQLSEYATQISNTTDMDEVLNVTSAYQEILGRILLVCSEFNLSGIQQICEFVEENLLKIVEEPVAERNACLDVLQGWPQVVITHLAEPEDDKLCIAVVDYLEHSDWPLPLPYTAVRGLLEGLTRELEISGEIEAEERIKVATAEAVTLTISNDANQDLVAAFFTESPHHAEQFSSLIQAISAGEQVQENVKAAQRIAHTLKGSANLVGVNGIASLAHHLEDIFEYLAKKKLAPPAALADSMLEAADCIEVMFESLQDLCEPPDNAQATLQTILDWANLIDQGDMTNETVLTETVPDDTVLDETGINDNVDAQQPTVSDLPESPEAKPVTTSPVKVDSIHVSANLLDHIYRLVGETSIAMSQMEQRLDQLRNRREGLRQIDTALQTRRLKLENQVSIRGMAAQHRIARAVGSDMANEHFDPLEMDEYDEFYSTTHAYIEAVSDMRAMSRNLNDEIAELEGLFQQQKHLNKELQEVVISTRMIPVSTIAGRLQRSVRQACRATGKNAELNISGEDLFLDGDVLNQLADPLMHVLRNAVDHGIEDPGGRFELGKPETGSIKLGFTQEGNNFVVECQDDGQGLDYQRIQKTAIKRGLLRENEQPDHASLARMILQSGFSTRDKATHISGRGVGMDVVSTAVQKLKGTMDILDNESGGTIVRIRLPITLLTSHCLLVNALGKVYAVPTNSLEQILPPGLGEFTTLGEGMMFQLGNDMYPVHTLDDMLSAAQDIDPDLLSTRPVLLVKADTGFVAVVINQVIASSDLVVKGMGKFIDHVHGISGVATLGDGNVVAVLDLPEMLRRPVSTNLAPEPADLDNDEHSVSSAARIMIVDDSLSVRQSLSQLVSDVGYIPIVARDGMEAVELLAKQQPDVMLVDMEMPRMNGLELTSYLRGRDEFRHVPVIMITSRTTEKHRQQATKAGVNHYLNKPYTEDDVVSTIESFL